MGIIFENIAIAVSDENGSYSVIHIPYPLRNIRNALRPCVLLTSAITIWLPTYNRMPEMFTHSLSQLEKLFNWHNICKFRQQIVYNTYVCMCIRLLWGIRDGAQSHKRLTVLQPATRIKNTKLLPNMSE